MRLIETHWDSLRLIETHWDSWRLIRRILRIMTMIMIMMMMRRKSLFLKRCSAERALKNYSSKVFIFSTFLIQSRNWHFKPGFFVVGKSIFNFSNWHLSIGKRNIFTLRFVRDFAFTFEILHVQICFKVTNLCAIRSHPCHYTELMLISSCILHLKRLLFESLFKIFDCVVIPSSCSNEHKLIQKIVLHSFRPDIN